MGEASEWSAEAAGSCRKVQGGAEAPKAKRQNEVKGLREWEG